VGDDEKPAKGFTKLLYVPKLYNKKVILSNIEWN